MNSNFTLLTLVLLCCMVAHAAPTPNNTQQPQLNNQWAFRENKGQVTDQFGTPRSDIHFQLHSGNTSAFIGRGNIHYQWNHIEKQDTPIADSIKGIPTETKVNTYRMDVALIGYNTDAVMLKENMLPGFDIFYSQGLDGAKAHSYQKITYQNIYPNIDWVLYIKDKTLKYDFVVRPGGKVSDIKIRYAGALDLKIEQEKLIALTPMGSVTEQKPYTYLAGTGNTINSAFVLNKDILSFVTGVYEGTLIIDPELRLEWATYYGGMGAEWGNYWHVQHGYDVTGCTVETDFEDNVYLSGSTSSVENIATTGSFQATIGNNSNVFLAKFNSKGQRLWGTYFGGAGGGAHFYLGTTTGRGHSIACDTLGNVYITGVTWNKEGVATPGAFQEVNGGANFPTTWPDLFLAKFNSSGNRLWATYYGSHGSEEGGSVAVTKDGGKIYLAGCSDPNIGQDFQVVSPNASMPYMGTSTNIPFTGFLARFNAAGERVWGTYIASTQIRTTVFDIAMDNQESIFLTGDVIGTSADPLVALATPGTFQLSYGGCTYGWGGPFCPPDAFVQKWDSMGSRIWGTYYGDVHPDYGYGITCDDGGNVYMTGETGSDAIMGSPGAYHVTPFDEGFLAKFNTTGQRIWGTYYSMGYGLSFNNHKLYVVGKTSKEDMATPCAYQTVLDDGGSGYLSRFDTTGFPDYITYYGGDGEDKAHSVCVERGLDEEKNAIYTAGFTNSPNDIATRGSHQESLKDHDMFLAKFYPPYTGLIASCFQEDSIMVTAKDTTGNNYTWTDGAIGTSLWVKTSGVYVVSYEIQPGCFTQDSFVINFYPIPVLDGPLITCRGAGEAIVNVTTDNHNTYTYSWHNELGALLKTVQSKHGDTLSGLGPGNYTLTIQTPLDCDTILPFTIEAFPDVVLTVSNDTTVPARSNVPLWASGAEHYSWWPDKWLDNTLIPAPVSSPQDPITYTVTGFNQYGCTATDSVRINIMENLFIPNAFSPNGDGRNDEFKIGNYGYQRLLEFRIFNRWGEQVFCTVNPDKGWDGIYKGSPAEMGTYSYYVRLNERDGKERTYKGDVTLLR